MKIFILEDSGDRMSVFREAFIEHEVHHERCVDEAKLRFKPPYDLLMLDHDLEDFHYFLDSTDENTGTAFAQWLVASGQPSCPVIVHSYNADGAKRMVAILRDAGWAQVSWTPFGYKVINEALQFGKAEGLG